MKPPGRLLSVATVLLLSAIWGTTWAAIRIGLKGIPPFLGVSLRFAIAAVALFALARFAGVRFGTGRRERTLWVVNGILSFCISYGVVYWSEQWVPSGLASVLFATFPLFVAVLAHFALPEESLGSAAAAGILIGLGGVALIFSEDFGKLGGPGVAAASVVMLISPLVSAVASVSVKKWGQGIHHLSLTAAPMGLAGIVMGALYLAMERDRDVTWTHESVGALLYLAIVGSALTFSLYYWLLAHLPATRVSLVAYLTPVVAVTVGAVFLDEPYTLRTLVGSALVVGGVALATRPARRAIASAAWLAACLLAATSGAASATDGPLTLPSDSAPAALRALGPLEKALSTAVSLDGTSAAAAFERPMERERGKRRFEIRVSVQGAAPRILEVDEAVRALRFGPTGESLYALVHRKPTRIDSGGTSFARLGAPPSRIERTVRVPLDAHDFDLSADGTAALVASRDEIRVILVPDLRSARIFTVAGENLSLAALPGGDRVLVGERDGIVLVDLSDRQTREGLPIRDRVQTSAPVAALAAAPDGSAALVRLADSRTFTLRLNPLRLEAPTTSAAIFWTGERIPYVMSVPPPAAAPPPAPEGDAEIEIGPGPTPSPEGSVPTDLPGPAAPHASAGAVGDARPVESEPQAVEEKSAPGGPASSPIAESDSPETVATSKDAIPPPPDDGAALRPPEQAQEAPQGAQERSATARAGGGGAPGEVHGRIVGPAAGEVRFVVLSGPNNVLREAARVAPDADGSWIAGPLEPGTYRVVLDAGGTRLLVSDPAFITVIVLRDGPVQATQLNALRVVRP